MFNPKIVCVMANLVKPEFPDPKIDCPVDFIGLVPGDVATIRIEAKSFCRVFVYKVISDDPGIKVERNGQTVSH